MIVLMRHAESEGGTGRCIGRTCLPLSAEGRERAEEAARRMVGAGFVRLCSSPASRAVDTLAPLAVRLGLEPEVLPDLDEIDMGEWDGLPFAEVRWRFPDAYASRGRDFAEFRPPSGESFADVADRAMSVLRRLAAGPRPVLAVTHAGFIRCVLCRLTGHPLGDLFHFTPGFTTCTVIGGEPGNLEVVGAGLAPSLLLPVLLS
ncbi:histidine phosphatase family protein [Pseudodesulfovibrio sp.]|uniref:histidine phosphatase family protein n=1 Tax=Pseudodesulfovibrio sp. TaxID=2035812 RepID=UPI002623356D|nr:histidine phosphatase family protein [Pseudodesulfovibrio sp.]MDD3312770.1 histidine phosphatase family protein [Pseudodesulfovibrio sp.]